MGKKLSKISTRVATSVIMFLAFTKVSFAQTALPGWVQSVFGNLISVDTTLEEFVIKVLNWGIGAAALVAVAFLVVAGFTYITAAGDEQKIGKATKTLTFAIVGLVICFIAVLIVNFVLGTFLDQTVVEVE